MYKGWVKEESGVWMEKNTEKNQLLIVCCCFANKRKKNSGFDIKQTYKNGKTQRGEVLRKDLNFAQQKQEGGLLVRKALLIELLGNILPFLYE